MVSQRGKKKKKVMKMNTEVNWFVLASSGGGRSSPEREMSVLQPPLQPALCCWTPQSPEGVEALKCPLVTCPRGCPWQSDLFPKDYTPTQQLPCAGAVVALTSPWLSQEVSPKLRPLKAPLSLLALLSVPTAAVLAPCPPVPVSPAPLPACSPGRGSLCDPSSRSAFHASGKRGFLRPLFPSLPLSHHAGCSQKGGSICVVWREAAWLRFWTPPSPDTFPTSPILLFLCVVEEQNLPASLAYF